MGGKKLSAEVKVRAFRVALAVLAACIFLSSFGTWERYLPNQLEINNPMLGSYANGTAAVVDNDGTRLLLLSDNDELLGRVNFEALDSPIATASDLVVCNDKIYVLGISFPTQTLLGVKEVLACYKHNGTLDKTIDVGKWIYENDSIEAKSVALKVVDNKPALITYVHHKDSGMSELVMHAIDQTEGDEKPLGSVQLGTDLVPSAINRADVSKDMDSFLVCDTYNNIFAKTKDSPDFQLVDTKDSMVPTAVCVAENGDMYVGDDRSGDIFKVEKNNLALVANLEYVVDIRSIDKVLMVCDKNAHKVVYLGENGQTVKEVKAAKPTFWRLLYLIAALLSIIYLVVYGTILIVRRIAEMLHQRKTRSLNRVFASVSVILLVMLSASFFTEAQAQQLRSVCGKQVSMMATLAKNQLEAKQDGFTHLSQVDSLSLPYLGTVDKQLIDAASAEAPESASTLQATYKEYNTLNEQLAQVSQAANANDLCLYYQVYGQDDTVGTYLVASTFAYLNYGQKMPESGETKLVRELLSGSDDVGLEDPHEGRNVLGQTVYSMFRLPGADGKGGIVVEVGASYDRYNSGVVSQLAVNLMNFLIIVIVIYLAYSEITACTEALLNMRDLEREGDPDAPFLIARPYTFLITMTQSIDAVVMVVLAKIMLSEMGLEDQKFLIALPAAFTALGYGIGQAAYSFLGSQIPMHKLAKRASLSAFLAACLVGLAVYCNSFAFYCAAKLLLSCSLGVIYSQGYTMQRHASQQKLRSTIGRDVSLTDVSALAMGTVFGGFAANYLGYIAVYVVAALTCLLLYFFVQACFKPIKKPIEEISENHTTFISILRLAFSKKQIVLLFVFCVIPAVAATGYNSYLFPLFASGEKMNISNISNLFVFGNMVVFAAKPSIDRVDKRLGKRNLLFASMGMLGLVLLIFIVNQTMAWCILAIMLVGVGFKTFDAAWKSLWVEKGTAAGLTVGEATSSLLSARSMASVVQPLMLSAFLAIGDKSAPALVGALCIIGAGIYWLCTREVSDPIAENSGAVQEAS